MRSTFGKIIAQWEVLRAVLGLGGWSYVFAVTGPLVGLDLIGKFLRIHRLGAAHGLAGYADQLRSEVLTGAGLILLSAGLFGGLRARWARGIALVVLHALIVLLLLLVIVGHMYFMVTGSILDLDTVDTALRSIGDIDGLIGATVSASMWIALSTAVACVLIAPAVIARQFSGSWFPLLNQPSDRPRWVGLAAGGLGIGLIGLAALPSLTVGSVFGRETVVSLVMQKISPPSFPAPPGYVPPVAADVPSNTQLVATAKTQKKNVVIIALESVRATATTLGDPSMPTTPFLSELAKTSTVVQQAHSVVPHTSKALVAMHCGVMPPLDADNSEARGNGIAGRCLPDLLKEQGYSTAFFQSATRNFEHRSDVVKQLGFQEFHPLESMSTKGFRKVNYFGYEDDILLNPIKKWTEAHRKAPFELSLLTVATHHNYVVPKGFPMLKLAKDPMLNNYLNLVRYEDDFIRQLIEQFKEQGLYDNTIFVILGDHGEGFGEHHRWQHDGTIYEEGLHIPMLIHDGGQDTPRTVSEPVPNTAVLPTVADLLGFRIAGGTYDASSMFAKSPPAPVIASCYRPHQCATDIEWPIKYIHHFGVIPDEMFNLATDPHERDNLLPVWDSADAARMRDEISARLHWTDDLYALHRSGADR